MSIVSEIKKSDMRVFRRILMKRRGQDGEYEATWQTIPSKYIKKFGNIDKGVDTLRQNFFSSNGFNFTVVNNDGFFSDVSDDKSTFYNKLSRYRTLIKVEAGYYDTDSSELPTDPSLFVGLLKPEMPYNQKNEINFKSDHLDQVFKEFSADRIIGLSGALTAKGVIEKVRDHVDGNAITIFQKYITSGGWIITSSAETYSMSTISSLEGKSVWDLMGQLAEAENNVMYISRSGDFYFRERDPTTTVEYHFSGIGDDDNTYGRNILNQISVDEDIRNVYNRVRIKFDKDDTSASYKTYNETWNWGDSSSSFKYGVRTYEYENIFMDAALASETAASIFAEFQYGKGIVKFKSKFCPQLDILGRVNVTYQTVIRTGESLWGYFLYGSGIWGSRTGKNIEIDGDYKIMTMKHNVEKFTTNFVLREI